MIIIRWIYLINYSINYSITYRSDRPFPSYWNFSDGNHQRNGLFRSSFILCPDQGTENNTKAMWQMKTATQIKKVLLRKLHIIDPWLGVVATAMTFMCLLLWLWLCCGWIDEILVDLSETGTSSLRIYMMVK